MLRWGIVTIVGMLANVAHAYPPPPLDCPPGQEGTIGGFCIPAACSSDTQCTDRCAARTGLEWAACRATSACEEREMCVQEIPEQNAGPYPTRYAVDSCGGREGCHCGPMEVCVASGSRAAVFFGGPAVALLLVLTVVGWRLRNSRSPRDVL